MTAIADLWDSREGAIDKEIRERTEALGDPAMVAESARDAASGFSPAPSRPEPEEPFADDDPVLGDLSGIYRRTVSA